MTKEKQKDVQEPIRSESLVTKNNNCKMSAFNSSNVREEDNASRLDVKIPSDASILRDMAKSHRPCKSQNGNKNREAKIRESQGFQICKLSKKLQVVRKLNI